MKWPNTNPWSWLTEERVTFALKLLMVLVLAYYLGTFVMGFLERIRAVTYVLIGSVFFAYLIYPIVERLRRRMPLVAAIAIVYAGIVAILVVVGAFLVPRFVDEASALVQHYPDFSVRVDSLLNDPNDPVTRDLPNWMRDEIAKIPREVANWTRQYGFEAASRVLLLLAGTFAAIATFIIIPLITAYLLLDLDNLKRGLSSIVPEDRWRATTSFLQDVDHVIGGFIRGQLLVALTVGSLITIALLILHVPYAFLLGLLAGVGDLIPYVGAILAFIPAFLTSLINNGWVNALIVAAAFLAIFEAEGHLIAPSIVSKTVRLSPFIVILALLIGAELGGLLGALIAVPITGVLRVIAMRVFAVQEANERHP